MKKLTVQGLATAAATLTSAGTLAFGYDSDSGITGGSRFELHAYSTASPHPWGCSAPCDPVEEQRNIVITNASSEFDEIGGPTGASPMVNNYTGDGGFSTNGTVAPEDQFIHVYYPGDSNSTFISSPDDPAPVGRRWDITTNVQGKITEGWTALDYDYDGTSFYIFYDLTRKQVTLLSDCPATSGNLPTDAEMQATPDGPTFTAMQQYFDGLSSSNGSPCTFELQLPLHYNTCDINRDCALLEKAVPIPAFAAALLGLGLFAMTYLTSKKHKIR